MVYIFQKDLHGLAHVARWEQYDLHDLAHASRAGFVLHIQIQQLQDLLQIIYIVACPRWEKVECWISLGILVYLGRHHRSEMTPKWALRDIIQRIRPQQDDHTYWNRNGHCASTPALFYLAATTVTPGNRRHPSRQTFRRNNGNALMFYGYPDIPQPFSAPRNNRHSPKLHMSVKLRQ